MLNLDELINDGWMLKDVNPMPLIVWNKMKEIMSDSGDFHILSDSVRTFKGSPDEYGRGQFLITKKTADYLKKHENDLIEVMVYWQENIKTS